MSATSPSAQIEDPWFFSRRPRLLYILPPAVSLMTPTLQPPARPSPRGVGPPRSPAPRLRCLVIVPTFNESRSVAKLVRLLSRSLSDFDVLVIDDGSTDDTIHQVPPHISVVSLPFNLGIGGAMQTGYRYAAMHGYDVAVQVDGDGQHRPSEVPRLIEAMLAHGADLVVGSRFLQRTAFRWSALRKIGIRMLSLWIRLLCGLSVQDCTSGFRAVNRRTILAYAHWYPEDYPEPEVLLLLHRSKFKVVEVPVRMRQRLYGRSSISLTGGMRYMIKVGLCLLLDTVRQPWPSGKINGV